jgi:hypothetical protein
VEPYFSTNRAAFFSDQRFSIHLPYTGKRESRKLDLLYLSPQRRLI